MFKAWLKRIIRSVIGFCLACSAVVLVLILCTSGLGDEPFARIVAALFVGCLFGPAAFLIYRIVRFAAY